MDEIDRVRDAEVISLFARAPARRSRRRPTPTADAWADRSQSNRHPSEVHGFRLRVDVGLDDEPPVWRELVVRGDVPCDRLHRAIGAAFGRKGGHRYRLHLGADPRAPRLLRPSEEQFIGLAGRIQSDVRLDELVARPGDELCHVEEGYDDLVDVCSISVVAVLDVPTVPVELVGGARLEYRRWGEPDSLEAFDLGAARVRVRAIDRLGSLAWRCQEYLRWATRECPTAQRLIADLDRVPAQPSAADIASAGVPWVRVLGGLTEGAEIDEHKRLSPTMVGRVAEGAGLPPARVEGLIRTVVAAGLMKIQRRRLELTRAGQAVVENPPALLPHLCERLALGRSRRDRSTGWATVLVVASGGAPEQWEQRVGDLLLERWPPSRFRRSQPDPDPRSPTLDAFEILGGMWFPGHGTPGVAQHIARRALGLL
ncbi:hypothetical protein J2S59_003191 [Nocardioides massiliensis]|uniref:Plasmid pRiA4b Orf3-like domain-containing protein n=2 Tax=Nocardioides massiliensis TaxID=1325935 RepID=A0ABT9NSX6_9ACTN|nr:hypothetical protein [Nocardioides massiliensis]MDP9823382.1 hypothetical protein [Nocardioides massiliensis]